MSQNKGSLRGDVVATLAYWSESGIHLPVEDPALLESGPLFLEETRTTQETSPSSPHHRSKGRGEVSRSRDTPHIGQAERETRTKRVRGRPTPPGRGTPAVQKQRSKAHASSPPSHTPSPVPVRKDEGSLTLITPDRRPVVMDSIIEEVRGCSQCALSTTRTNTVPGVGALDAPIVFVGEGPGADEDRQGEPFVGAAGKLLTKMIESIGYKRSEIYIANVVKCRPPGNRNPQPDEIAACQDYLYRQLECIHPKIIMALGKFSIALLTGHDGPVGRARGRVFMWRGVPVIATYHPAYYLRQPAQKRHAWNDLLLLNKTLEQKVEDMDSHSKVPQKRQ
ncbi:MAG: uracil-DNA glycosylase [Magnetococcales bacterium]|nr:uracil-DNA glycosylase [Magnetococcales bacterium]